MTTLFRSLLRRLKSRTQITTLENSHSPETSRTVEKWNESDTVYQTEGFKEYWELLEDVQRHEALLMAQGKDIIEYISSFFPQDKRLADLVGLIVGCTYGAESPAVALARTGAFKTLLIVDLAEGLLLRQSQITDNLDLNHIMEYKRMDLNVDPLPDENIYDLIFANGTIHHIRELESLFVGLNGALREDGLFIMKEYVGPSCLQFTEKQIQLANRLLQCLPDYLKRQKNGIIRREPFRPTMAEIIHDDPSEAVRSQDIMTAVEDTLEVLACNPTGGTILHPLLHAIAGNFERGEPERAVLKTMIVMEQTLIEEGVIPSDYVFLIARKKRK